MPLVIELTYGVITLFCNLESNWCPAIVLSVTRGVAPDDGYSRYVVPVAEIPQFLEKK